jgi:uncharacterized protein DUF4136
MKQVLFTFAALSIAACGPSISADRDPSVPIPAGATWAWGQRDTVSHYELDPVVNNKMLHQSVQTAIIQTMTNKGFKQVEDPSQATLLLTYHVGIKREQTYETTTTGVGGWYGGYGWGYYGAPTFTSSTTRPVEYRTGALLVYLRDRASGKVAWQGLYTKDVHDTMKVPHEKVQEAVDDLFATLKK